MKRNDKMPAEHYSMGFRFSPLDELSMQLARRKARIFMETFGRGYTPRKIDLRHYSPGVTCEE